MIVFLQCQCQIKVLTRTIVKFTETQLGWSQEYSSQFPQKFCHPWKNQSNKPTQQLYFNASWASVQFSSVTQSCLTLYNPINCSTPGLPVHHQLPEFTQTHVHRVSDAIQPSYPLSSPFPPAPNPSQHQSLFQ